jgi:hypothetical protein
MRRNERLMNNPGWPHDSTACDDGGEHRWQPVSFTLWSTEADPHAARVYVVCMECHTHTYLETEWAGYHLGGPPGLDSEGDARDDSTEEA